MIAMSAASISSGWVGQQVNGRYTLLEWLGGTADGGVFRSEVSASPDQKVAIHIVAAESDGADARLAGWTIAKALPHPHLVHIFETGRAQVDGAAVVYLVTEYAEEVLSEVLRDRALTSDEAHQMLPPLLEALSYLHGRGFVHGHVKPSNILVVGEQIKLSAEGQVTQYELQKRPALGVYDAPEIGSGAVSTSADVWSLGATLVKTLTQHAPEWARPARDDPAILATVPEPFAQIARECLRVDPVQRCSLDRVKALLGARPVAETDDQITPAVIPAPPVGQAAAPPEPAPVSKPASPAGPLRPPQSVPRPASPLHHPAHSGELDEPSRSRLSVMPLVIVFVVLVAIIIVLFTRSHKPPPAQESTTQTQSVPETPMTPSGKGATRKGAVSKRVEPDVRAGASRSIRGTVVVSVRVNVDAAGRVTNAELLTPGPSKYFARVALESARQWQFKPPQQGGRVVASQWLLSYRFRNDGPDVDPKQELP